MLVIIFVLVSLGEVLLFVEASPAQQAALPTLITVKMFQLSEADSSSLGIQCSAANGNLRAYGCSWDGNINYPYTTNPITISIEDDYLLDVVPRELNPEQGYARVAIQAQAIAARTYAYNKIAAGLEINNSTANQVFVPFYFDRLGLDEDASLNNPLPTNSDPCLRSDLRADQRTVCQAVNLRRYVTATGSTNPAFSEFFADITNNTIDEADVRRSVADPISAACDADNSGHGRGMSQEGASRWARGNRCSTERAVNSIPWTVRWLRPDQILAHYYTAIDLRSTINTNTKFIADMRWVPLQINWGAGLSNPPDFRIGDTHNITVQVQNVSTTDWTCPTGTTYLLSYRWVRYVPSEAIVGNVSTQNLCGLGTRSNRDIGLIINDIPNWPVGTYDLRFDITKRVNGVDAWFRSQAPSWQEYAQRVRICSSTGCAGRAAREQDYVLAFDTTGSMYDSVIDIQNESNAIINAIASSGDSYRVAIVEYRDFPPDDNSFATRVALNFSSDQNAINSAIDTLVATGGGDIPETVYSAVASGISLSWRPNAAKKIIVVGDAKAKNPEPVTGYTSLAIANLALNVGNSPVQVDTVALGYDVVLETSFQNLIAGVGGRFYRAPTYSNVAETIIAAINNTIASPLANSGGPYNGFVGQAISLSAINSFDPENVIVSYEWDLDGDGAFDEGATEPIFDFTYNAPYSGRILLRTTDTEGNIGIDTAQVNVTQGGSDIILADSFESGNLSAWSSSVTDGGDLSVTGAAALQGSFGMQALIDGTGTIYVTDETPAAEPFYRAQFRIDPNSLTMGADEAFDILGLDSGTTAVVRLQLRRTAGDYRLQFLLIDNSGTVRVSPNTVISDGPHTVQFDWSANSTAGATDGSAVLSVNGVPKVTMSGAQVGSRRLDRVRFGASGSIDAGTSGTFFLDDFQSWRTN